MVTTYCVTWARAIRLSRGRLYGSEVELQRELGEPGAHETGRCAPGILLARREILGEDVIAVVAGNRVGVEHVEDVDSDRQAAIVEPEVLRELEVEQRDALAESAVGHDN